MEWRGGAAAASETRASARTAGLVWCRSPTVHEGKVCEARMCHVILDGDSTATVLDRALYQRERSPREMRGVSRRLTCVPTRRLHGTLNGTVTGDILKAVGGACRVQPCGTVYRAGVAMGHVGPIGVGGLVSVANTANWPATHTGVGVR